LFFNAKNTLPDFGIKGALDLVDLVAKVWGLPRRRFWLDP
jgi:hypothetical protein